MKALDENSEEVVYFVYSFSEAVILSQTALFYKGVLRRDYLHA